MPTSATTNIHAYLSHNVLHIKPLSSRLLFNIMHSHVEFSKVQIQTKWKANIVKVLTNTFKISTCLIAAQIASIECIAAATIGLSSIFVHYFFTTQNTLTEKFTIKTLTYSLHSLSTLPASLYLVYLNFKEIILNRWIIPKYHWNISKIDGSNYLVIAAFSQFLFSKMFNFINGKQNTAPLTRSRQAVIEGTPMIFSTIIRSINRDYQAISESDETDTSNFAREFTVFHSHIELGNMDTFNFKKFITSVLNPLNQLVNQYFDQNNFIENTNILEQTETEIILNPFNQIEKSYHDHLKACVKQAVRDMLEKRWVKYVDSDNDFAKGKERLAWFDASCTQPLANVAQFIELKKTIACPPAFNNEDLSKHNGRRQKIQTLKQLLEQLSQEDETLLIERLIKIGSFKLGSRSYQNKKTIEDLYRGIYTLSGDLHQGKLLTLPTVNTENNEVGGRSYFGTCWGEAIKDYEDRAE